MALSIDDLVKLALTFAACFALIGISIQIIRLFGGVIESIKDFNRTIRNAADLTEKFVEDYDYISEQIRFIIDGISGFIRNVFMPLTRIFGFVKTLEKIPFVGRKKKKEEDEEIDE